MTATFLVLAYGEAGPPCTWSPCTRTSIPRGPAKEAIQKALASLLQDTTLHQRVRAMARKLQTLDSPRLAAEALEKLVAGRTALHSVA